MKIAAWQWPLLGWHALMQQAICCLSGEGRERPSPEGTLALCVHMSCTLQNVTGATIEACIRAAAREATGTQCSPSDKLALRNHDAWGEQVALYYDRSI